jgi:hypothetical protein
VEWLDPAAPGVDAKWDMQVYGLVMFRLSRIWKNAPFGLA